jgi:hypothetical protein
VLLLAVHQKPRKNQKKKLLMSLMVVWICSVVGGEKNEVTETIMHDTWDVKSGDK